MRDKKGDSMSEPEDDLSPLLQPVPGATFAEPKVLYAKIEALERALKERDAEITSMKLEDHKMTRIAEALERLASAFETMYESPEARFRLYELLENTGSNITRMRRRKT
jgi:hypothetical protein